MKRALFVFGWLIQATVLTIARQSAQGSVNGDTFDFSAQYSPGGSKIAFASRRDGTFHIYVMNADGSNQTRLTNSKANDQGPSWSPDGLRIAFFSDRDGNSEIYVMNSDGSNQKRLTSNSSFDGELPAWSPDGSRLAFYSNRDGNNEIYVMNPDGSNQTRITHNASSDTLPVWSPDGSRLLFSSDRFGHIGLFVMNADGSNIAQLTKTAARDDYATWSPDGSRIVFISNRDDPAWEIYIMNADGSSQARLTRTRDWDLDPAFSPDGKMIIFNSRRDGRRGIYVMNADGSNQTKLTNLEVNPFITLVREKGIDAALASYRASKKSDPKAQVFTESELRNLAYWFLDNNQADDAIKLFKLVSEAYPTSSLAFSCLSEAYGKAGRTAPPTEAQFINLIKAKGPVEARKVYRQVKRENPEWVLISEFQINRLGNDYLKEGQLEFAIQAFKLGLETYPKSAGLYDGLGEAYLKSGNKKLARRSYQRSLAINPNSGATKAKLKSD